MTLYHSPFQTALDANGDPVSGAKLNFFEAGTSTRQNTFTTPTLTTAHANPVIANSAGRFPSIYLLSSGYKVVLTDAADVEIDNEDNVKEFSGGFLTVTEFGAIGDGVADDTVAIQAAVDAATAANNEVIHVPPGTYLITTVNLDKNTKIFGDGVLSTKFLIKSGSTYEGLKQSNVSISKTSLMLRDFMIEAQDGDTLKHSTGIKLTNVAQAFLQNIHFQWLVNGLHLDDGLINNCNHLFVNACTKGIFIEGAVAAANVNRFSFLRSRNCDFGVYITGLDENKVYGNSFPDGDFEFNAVAIFCDTASSPNKFPRCNFEGNEDVAATANLIQCLDTKNGKIDLIDCMFGQGGATKEGAYIDPANSTGVIRLLGQTSFQSTGSRITIPTIGSYEVNEVRFHNFISDIEGRFVNNRTKGEHHESGIMSGKNSIQSYIYGSLAPFGGATITNHASDDWNLPANLFSGTGTGSKADPIGGTTAFEPTSTIQWGANTAVTTGHICFSVFIKSISSGQGRIVLTFLDGTTVKVNISYSFNGTSDWNLIYLNFDLDSFASSGNHRFQITEGNTKVNVWGAQMLTGTKYPAPLLPFNYTTTTPQHITGLRIIADRIITATADDTTPSVAGVRTLLIPANTVPTGITQFDGGVAGQTVRIIMTSSSDPSTIADSGNFKLSAAFVPNIDDVIQLFTIDGSTWIEERRSAN